MTPPNAPHPVETAGAQVITRNLPGNGASSTGTAGSRAIMAEAARALTAAGHAFRPAELRVLVGRFRDAGGRQVAEVEPYVLGYYDPTGEKAVRNVDAERVAR